MILNPATYDLPRNRQRSEGSIQFYKGSYFFTVYVVEINPVLQGRLFQVNGKLSLEI